MICEIQTGTLQICPTTAHDANSRIFGVDSFRLGFPCRITDINVLPCRPLPPSDAFITTNGLSSDRIRLVATGAPIPLLKFMLLEQHVRPKADLKVFMAMFGIAFETGMQVQRCYDLLFRHCFPDCSDDDLQAMVQKMFEAPTQDELIEQEFDPLMREALLAVDPEEAALQSDEGSVPTRRHQEEIWCETIARSCRAEP